MTPPIDIRCSTFVRWIVVLAYEAALWICGFQSTKWIKKSEKVWFSIRCFARISKGRPHGVPQPCTETAKKDSCQNINALSRESRWCGPNWTRFLHQNQYFLTKCVPNIAGKIYFLGKPCEVTELVSKVHGTVCIMLFEWSKTDENWTSYKYLNICIFCP